MRLIDADELIKGRIENDPAVIAAKCAPTAYDVDKVVGQLQEKILEIKDQLMYTYDENMATRLRCKMHGLDEALEIVKAGGVNEKKTEKPDYQNSAGILRSRQRGKETL